mgnify:CR=1 FL=1
MKQTQEEWRIVFIITAVVYMIGAVALFLLTSASIQPWAVYHPEEDEVDTEVEKHNPHHPQHAPHHFNLYTHIPFSKHFNKQVLKEKIPVVSHKQESHHEDDLKFAKDHVKREVVRRKSMALKEAERTRKKSLAKEKRRRSILMGEDPAKKKKRNWLYSLYYSWFPWFG